MIKAEQDAHLLSDEARRAAEYLRIDFEKGGIHLCQGTICFQLFFFFSSFHVIVATKRISPLFLQRSWTGSMS